jgi:hypothetical protein
MEKSELSLETSKGKRKKASAAMENIMLTVKFVLFLAMEVFVVATMGAVLILGLYQIVKDKIRESRYLDKVASETQTVTQTTH